MASITVFQTVGIGSNPIWHSKLLVTYSNYYTMHLTVNQTSQNKVARMREKIGTIKGIDLIKKSAPKANISFRTGKYITEKDRPRDKSYKKYKYEIK